MYYRIILKSRLYMRWFCQGVHFQKMCVNEEKENTGIRCNISQQQRASFGTR